MKIKKVISFFITLVMIVTIIPVGTFSTEAMDESNTADLENICPLDVQFDTNKLSYSTIETAVFTVTITNTSERTITNISSMSDFECLQPVGSDNTLYVDGITLNPGECISYSYSATVHPSTVFIFLKLILLVKYIFIGIEDAPCLNFDNGRNKISISTGAEFGGFWESYSVDVWYEQPTEIIESKSKSEFEKEVSEIINNQIESKTFDKNLALKEKYYTQRINVEGEKLDTIDLLKYSPDTIIYNEDNTKAVVQFCSQSLTKTCEKELGKLENVKVAEADIIIATSADEMTWGKSYIKADSYEHYLEKNNFFNIITVAVVDTGVDIDHSYLKNRIASNGYDFVNIDTNPDDDNGHGTHIAGIIANCTAGLNVKILPMKVMGESGLGSSYIIAQGIRQAANNGANVINLSLGGKKSKILDDAVNYAVKEKNAVVCVAAGNGDDNGKPVDTSTISPACVTEAIVVAALDNKGKIASFSNYGSSVDVAAPGVDVYSTYKNGSYAKMSGTSMATPHISAVAAMFKLAYPNYTPAQIETLVEKYCMDLGTTGRDDIYGYGTVNMYNAIPDCTVKFNTNGGSSSNNQTVKSSDEITLPKPTKSYVVKLNANGGSISTSSYTRNCTLEGWYKFSSLTGTRYAPGGLYMARNDETLYAKWTNPTLGDFNKPSRTNYRFDGWYTATSGGTQYTSVKEITGNITLYAHWTPIPFDVPNYAGWDLGQATNNLTANGMKYTTSYAYNNSYASGKVYSQSITGSTARGNTVALYVSSGPKPLASGDWVVFNGGTTLYRTVAGGPKNGVYKADASEGDITGVYTYNGTTYYQFRYAGNTVSFGWAPSWAFTQLS